MEKDQFVSAANKGLLIVKHPHNYSRRLQGGATLPLAT